MTFREYVVILGAPSLLLASATFAILCCSPRPIQPGGAETPLRAQARGAVLAVADGVRMADVVCGPLAKARKDLTLAESCSEEYRHARAALVEAERVLDETGDVTRATCETLPAVKSLEAMTRLIATPNVPAIDDAFALATRLISVAPCLPRDAR